ncbi:MAG TPA: tripartite tricarboxylate transporter TctB family protein [Xanthobacteraceae bacterium]|nr:tripartite tricarboxylate transporter TctB family protein [Xanthobacteraceae bacterium]
MSDVPDGAADAGPSHRAVEVGVAVLTAIFALIVLAGSLDAGIDWGDEGPRAGFFPFYVGLFILGGSIVNFVQVWTAPAAGGTFAQWSQLRQVLSVVAPTAIYVALVPWLGIYVSSMVLIAIFMKWLGRYGWGLVLPVALGVPLITFIVFERWFLVPLPKGPVEEFLGF